MKKNIIYDKEVELIENADKIIYVYRKKIYDNSNLDELKEELVKDIIGRKEYTSWKNRKRHDESWHDMKNQVNLIKEEVDYDLDPDKFYF